MEKALAIEDLLADGLDDTLREVIQEENTERPLGMEDFPTADGGLLATRDRAVAHLRAKGIKPRVQGYCLYGLDSIAAFFEKDRKTIGSWIRHHGFPACPLPDGTWFITLPLIDAWCISRHGVWLEEWRVANGLLAEKDIRDGGE